MNATKLTIGGVLLTALGTLLARFTGLVTDEQLLNAFVAFGVVVGFTLLAWIWGAGITEFQKRTPLPKPFRIPPPWTKRAALEMFEERVGHVAPGDPDEVRQRMELLKHADKMRGMIYFASCMNGGITLCLLLKGYFEPATFIGWMLLIIYGQGVGGLMLPTVYQVVVHELWPRLRAKGKKGIEVRRDDAGQVVAIKDLDKGDATEILRPGQKPPTAG